MRLPRLRPIYTQSCFKETPSGKSPSHTRVGPQALLDRVTVFRGAANDLEIRRATNFASAAHLPQSIHPPATCALVDTECHGSPSVAKHASISNSETSPARRSEGSLRTVRNKSTVDTAAALLKAISQDFADIEPIHTNIELVGYLTILQNQTIFENSIRTINIGNLDLVVRPPISTARHDNFYTDSDDGLFPITCAPTLP